MGLRPSVVDWGVAWQHNCGSKVRCADNGHRYAIASADQPPLPRLYSATGMALRRR